MENSRTKKKKRKKKIYVLNLAGLKETWYSEVLDQRSSFFLWDLCIFDQVSNVGRMCMTNMGEGAGAASCTELIL